MQSHKGQRMIYKTLHRTDNAITQRDKEWSTKHYTEGQTMQSHKGTKNDLQNTTQKTEQQEYFCASTIFLL